MACVNLEHIDRYAVCGIVIVLKMEDYMSKTLEEFEQYLDKMKKYEHINTLLYWDMRTCAPKLGQAGHIDALTYFSTESFAMSTSDELYGMLETLKTPEEFAQLSDTMKFIVTRMQRDM